MGRVRIDTNWPKIRPEYEKLLKAGGRHTVLFVNNASYAAALHAKRGYYVFNVGTLGQIVYRHIRKVLRYGVELDLETLRDTLEAGAIEAIDWHRTSSFAFGRRPPVRAGYGERKAHPGGWADVHGLLANSYAYKIDTGQLTQTEEWKNLKQAARARKLAARRRRKRRTRS